MARTPVKWFKNQGLFRLRDAGAVIANFNDVPTVCLKHSPDNLDCLLSLGVSCANTLDEVKAMNFLKRWLMLNPKYQMKGIDGIIPDEMVNLPTYKI